MPSEAIQWLLFLAALSGQNANTQRVRLWRALKELGVATLRDGATLLPDSATHRAKLGELAGQIIREGGTAWLLELPEQAAAQEEKMQRLFDRAEAYRDITTRCAELKPAIPHTDEISLRQQLRHVERQFDAIAEIDFFPGAAQAAARQAMQELTQLINRRFSPEEPAMESGQIKRLDRQQYQARLWATRRHLWVDRVASAWLIRRFIDKQARFLWLANPAECPPEALGFDFDGAPFTHVEDRVTFEVLQASFGLDDDPALGKLAQLVHYLDVGGIPVAEAAGFEAVLAGLRKNSADDDVLLLAAAPVLDALYEHYAVPAA